MKYLATLLIVLAVLSATGCFKKKKELSEWARYQAGAEAAINSLRSLQSLAYDGADENLYKTELEKTQMQIDRFLRENQSEPDRASRVAVESALRDLRLVAELIERKKNNTGQFSAGKLFASADTELFNNVKQRYQLGPELMIARQPYYFIDSIIQEAWRSAGNNIYRAGSKLTEEAAADAKARRTKSTAASPKPASNTALSPKPGI